MAEQVSRGQGKRCLECRKKHISCSNTFPCTECVEKGSRCSYLPKVTANPRLTLQMFNEAEIISTITGETEVSRMHIEPEYNEIVCLCLRTTGVIPTYSQNGTTMHFMTDNMDPTVQYLKLNGLPVGSYTLGKVTLHIVQIEDDFWTTLE